MKLNDSNLLCAYAAAEAQKSGDWKKILMLSSIILRQHILLKKKLNLIIKRNWGIRTLQRFRSGATRNKCHIKTKMKQLQEIGMTERLYDLNASM